jgi:hypothetical protein
MPMERARLHKHGCTRRPDAGEADGREPAHQRCASKICAKERSARAPCTRLAREVGRRMLSGAKSATMIAQRSSRHCGCGPAAPSPAKMLSASATLFHTPMRAARRRSHAEGAIRALSMARSGAQSERAAVGGRVTERKAASGRTGGCGSARRRQRVGSASAAFRPRKRGHKSEARTSRAVKSVQKREHRPPHAPVLVRKICNIHGKRP